MCVCGRVGTCDMDALTSDMHHLTARQLWMLMRDTLGRLGVPRMPGPRGSIHIVVADQLHPCLLCCICRCDPTYICWLARCYIMNAKADEAWSLYQQVKQTHSQFHLETVERNMLAMHPCRCMHAVHTTVVKPMACHAEHARPELHVISLSKHDNAVFAWLQIEGTRESFALLQVIANDFYCMGAFFYAAQVKTTVHHVHWLCHKVFFILGITCEPQVCRWNSISSMPRHAHKYLLCQMSLKPGMWTC